MRITMLMFVVAGMLGFAAGCKSTTEVDTVKEFGVISTDEEKDMEVAGKRFGEDILKAIKDSDYELLTRNIMKEYLKNINEADFKKSCEEYRKHSGEQRGATYLGSMRNGPLIRVYVWKVEFSKTAKDKEGKESTLVYDKLFSTIVVKSDGKYYVLGFRFL